MASYFKIGSGGNKKYYLSLYQQWRMKTTYATYSSNDIVGLPTSGAGATSSSSSSAYNSSSMIAAARSVDAIPFQLLSTMSSLSSSSSSSSSATNSVVLKLQAKIKRMTWNEWIEMFLPCYRWIRTYKWREYLQVDLMAGLTVGIMLVPQSMSYAKLAGLQPIYGLYSGLVPIFVYALFGSSRQLAIGPVSFISLIVSNSLIRIVDPSDELYTRLAILLALMVGILEFTLGFLRLGWLIRFISHSVISGFTTASAVVIGLSQAKYFLGYSIEPSSQIIPLVKSIISGADKFLWPPFVMGSMLLAILLVMKKAGKRNHFRFLQASGPLTAVVLGTVFVKIYHPSSISLVGPIHQGLPKFTVPNEFSHITSLIPTAFLITGVAILESVGVAKALAVKNGYELDSNQELFGLGVANIAGSFFLSYPTTGAFSRSAVNQESGAKTGLSGIVMGFIMTCVLLFMTPLFECIPQCALAAIVVSAVIGLVDYDKALFLWRVDKKDFVLWIITCIITLFFGIEIGVLVGVGVSLAFVIHESANPHVAVLGCLPGTTIYRNIQQYPEAYTYNGIVVVRIDAPIYFANICYIKDRLREFEFEFDGSSKHGLEVAKVQFLILDMAPVTYIDSSAVEALKNLYHEYRMHDIQIAISDPNCDVLLTLDKGGAVDLIGKEWYFVRVHDAVQICLQNVQSSNEDIKNLPKQIPNELSKGDLESGHKQNVGNGDLASELEPLLSN